MKEYKLDLLPSPLDNRDFLAESIFATPSLPSTLDYRPELQPVRDQGSQGSCAAHVAACIKEWHEKREVKLNEYMSPQFVYNNRANQAQSGMYSRDVMKILHKKGCCTEKMFPYGKSGAPSEEAMREAANYKIKGYAQVTTVAGLKTALYKNGPCYIGFPVYNMGAQFWKPATKGQPRIGGHAVTVVGYNKEG